MGYTTRVSDYVLDNATTTGPEVEGVDVEGEVRAKVVDAPEKKPAKKTTGAQAKRAVSKSVGHKGDA